MTSADKIKLALRSTQRLHKGHSTDDIIEAIGQVIDQLTARVSRLEYKDAQE